MSSLKYVVVVVVKSVVVEYVLPKIYLNRPFSHRGYEVARKIKEE